MVTSTSSSPVEFTVDTLQGNMSNSSTVSHGNSTFVDIPVDYMVTNGDSSNRNKGIHVSTNDSQISIVAVNVNDVGIQDGATSSTYNILPHITHTTLSEYEYFAVSTGSNGDRASEILLVGTQDDTEVTIFTSQLDMEENPNVTEMTDMSNMTDMTEPTNTTGYYTVTLDRLQTVLITKKVTDLTGSRIVSDKPLSVFSGNECGNVPYNMNGCDHIGVHLPPTVTWGREFMLTSFLGRNTKQIFKMISSCNDTRVECTCSGQMDVFSFTHPGHVRTIEIENYQSCYLKSNNPLLVAQLSQSNTVDLIGDPAMVIVPPIEQYGSTYSFQPLSGVSNNYITIFTTKKHFKKSNILLDNKAIQADWTSIFNSADEVVGYSCKLKIMADTEHMVKHMHPEGKISVLVYGFDNRPRHAYAFEPATGMRMLNNGEYVC